MADNESMVMEAPATEAPGKDEFLNQLQALDNSGADMDLDRAVEAKAEPAKTEPAAKEPEVKQEVAPKEAVKPTEAKADEAVETKQEGKSKWAKEQDRKARTWEQINAEKQALANEKAALEKARKEVESTRRTPADQPYRDEYGNTVQDIRNAVKAMRAKGDAEAYKQAEQLEAYGESLMAKEAQHRTEAAQRELQEGWAKNFADLAEKNPDLKKADSDLYKATVAIINRAPYLTGRPDGINAAVEAAQLQLEAKSLSSTREELAKLKTEYEKLQKKLSISGGSPTAPAPKAKSPDDMDHKELGNHLRKLAAEGDAERGFAGD